MGKTRVHLRGFSIAAGIGVVLIATLLRALLALSRAWPPEAGLLLYLGGVLVAGWLWGEPAVVASKLVGTALALTVPLGASPTHQAFGVPLFLACSTFYLYVINQEREERKRGDAQAALLRRERERSEQIQVDAAAEQRRAEEVAREQRRVLMLLQKETLGAADPNVPGLTFALAYTPATAAALVGGDFYNVFRLSEHRAAVILGDVTGKGAQAAAAGVVLSNMLRAFFAESDSPASVLRRLNVALANDGSLPVMATVFAAVVDGREGTLVYANAAQEPPCLVGPWGTLTMLESTGMAIGAFADAEYEERTIAVSKGHLLIAFTDGLTEIRMPKGNWMDPQRTYARAAELGGHRPADVVKTMIEWARSMSGGALRDDAALLAIEFTGTKR